MKPWEQNLAKLRNTPVAVSRHNMPESVENVADYDEYGATIFVKFSDGTVLRASYWRFIQNGGPRLSSFDHHQQYGLPAAIDAKEKLCNLLEGKLCHKVEFDPETADLILTFGETTQLQVFRFTAYEDWEISFPDGTGEYCNYAVT